MKKFKPKLHEIVCWIIPEGTNNLFISTATLEDCRISKKAWEKNYYEKLLLDLGKNVFVFDVEACEFTEKKQGILKRKTRLNRKGKRFGKHLLRFLSLIKRRTK